MEMKSTLEKPKNKAEKMAKIIFPPSSNRTLEQEQALLQRPEILRDRIIKAEEDMKRLQASPESEASKRQLEFLEKTIKAAKLELGYTETRIAHEK